MADWSLPTLTSTYTNFLTQLTTRDTDLALQFDGTTTTNIPTGAIRWNSSINRWQKWSGTAWGELATTYALTALSTTGAAAIGGTLAVTGTSTFTGNATFSGAAPIISALIGPTAAQQHTLPAVTSDTVALLAAAQTLTNKTLTAPTITGGTHTALTSLGIRSTGTGAYDLTLANTENLTAARTLTIKVNDAARLLNLAGDVNTAGAFSTAGAFALTLTATAATNVTLPTTGTLATLAGTETFTNKTLTAPTLTGGTINNTPIGGTTAAAGAFTTLSATGDVTFTSTGFLDIPTGTTAQRPASPNTGMLRFNTTLGKFEGYNGSVWSSVGGGATGGGSDSVFQENSTTVTTSYTLSTGKSASSVGPVTLNTGVTVTVPTGARWVVL